ncbi:MAG: type II toxin-antitoxin system PemK/MazF family toxin [Dehalococcoidales bacterium]|jgi:mRNA interferase MazF|nr:type II toxin-antitoxin system PemK/MazF family toxin [Dehalococcoidales bacterium]
MPQDIKRGEIYWIDFSPGRGSEQSGLRPALVIQNDVGNKFSPTTIVAALTTAVEKSYPFLVKVTAEESGLPEDSTVNLAVILTVDKTRLKNKCGELNSAKMLEVNEAIRASLGL